MEHSLLHAVALWGIVIVTGGPLMVLGLLRAANKNGAGGNALAAALRQNAGKWVFYGAAITALAGLPDLFVHVAEVRGNTVFGGVSISDAVRFATRTHTGQLVLARTGILLAAALVAWKAPDRRWKWGMIGALAGVAIVLTALVSHAAAQPAGRAGAVLTLVVHVGGAAMWLGVLLHFLAARQAIQRSTGGEDLALLAGMVRRFSPLALTVVSLLLLSGVIVAYRFLGGGGALFRSAYGLTLQVKLVLLLPALFAGAVNHWIIRPSLLTLRDANDSAKAAPVLRRFGRMLELEVTSGVLVLAVAGILASISPPAENRSLLLTEKQMRAVTSPRVPSANVPDPAGFYGAPTRTTEDLRYAEFTHHYSGVMVCVLGLCWLVQGAGGRIGVWSGRIWPLLLVPFAGFVAMASDPEVWWLRRVPQSRALADPQLIEHQLGAVLVLLLIWLGLRDGRRPESMRPLGYALPVVLVLGSLMLLGHAHSTLAADDALLNLINVQHAVFGAFGLFAGVVRWFSLRGLFPSSIARWLWPSLVIGLGLFMTFCYREAV